MAASPVMKLQIEILSSMAVEPTSGNAHLSPFARVMEILQSASELTRRARLAHDRCRESIRLVREAADPNPWKNSTDDEIASEILRRLEERRSQQLGDRHVIRANDSVS